MGLDSSVLVLDSSTLALTEKRKENARKRKRLLAVYVYFHCNNYVIIEDIVPCSNNDRFLWVNKSLL